MYGRPEPASVKVLPTRPSKDGSGMREGVHPGRPRVHEVRPHRADPFEVLRHLVRGTRHRGVRGLVELLGDEHVLGHLDRVLQQPMDEDDVDPDELAPVPDGLRGDLADVCDELQLQVVRLGQPSHGHRFVATYWRSRWNALCMAMAAWFIRADRCVTAVDVST